VSDPLLEMLESDPDETQDAGAEPAADPGGSRQRYRLTDDTGFDEVPKKVRRFYRRWRGDGDELAPNEVVCPVCKVVVRSSFELWPGDRVYCMPCMSRLSVVRSHSGRLEARVEY
jgi:hypothetical protein